MLVAAGHDRFLWPPAFGVPWFPFSPISRKGV